MPRETVREERYVNASMGEREGVGIGSEGLYFIGDRDFE